MIWSRITTSLLLVSYLLSMVAVYLPHTHEHQFEVATICESGHPHSHQQTQSRKHSHHSCGHRHSESEPVKQSDKHSPHRHSPHEHDDDSCIVCQYQIQSQDTPLLDCGITFVEQTIFTECHVPLAVESTIIRFFNSRAPPLFSA